MTPGRRTWYVASALFLLGATAAFGAVHQHWLPCRGSMLSGSVVNGYAYGTDFTDGCLKAMDDGFAFVSPAGGDNWSAESIYGAITALLLGLAWWVVVARSPWSVATRQIALTPAYASVGLAVLGVVGGAALEPVVTLLLLVPNLLALITFVVIVATERLSLVAAGQVALALAATSVLGLVPSVADYVLMASWSDANWDAPPGSGCPTVAVLVLPTLGLIVVTAVGGRSQAASSKASAAVSALP